jgi:hypothetical protein
VLRDKALEKLGEMLVKNKCLKTLVIDIDDSITKTNDE